MANEKDLENLIEKKFMTQEKFSKDIEHLVHTEKDFNYIDAVVSTAKRMRLKSKRFLN